MCLFYVFVWLLQWSSLEGNVSCHVSHALQHDTVVKPFKIWTSWNQKTTQRACDLTSTALNTLSCKSVVNRCKPGGQVMEMYSAISLDIVYWTHPAICISDMNIHTHTHNEVIKRPIKHEANWSIGLETITKCYVLCSAWKCWML